MTTIAFLLGLVGVVTYHAGFPTLGASICVGASYLFGVADGRRDREGVQQ